jgi:hypothetical protein
MKLTEDQEQILMYILMGVYAILGIALYFMKVNIT